VIADKSCQDSPDANESKGKADKGRLLLQNPPDLGFRV
jgi:hypothetical protein